MAKQENDRLVTRQGKARKETATWTEAPETMRHTHKPRLKWVRENNLVRGSLAWGAAEMLTSEVHEMARIHRAHGLAGLTAWLAQGAADLWLAFSFMPAVSMVACVCCSGHYGGLFLVHIFSGLAGGSVDVVHAALSAFACCLTGYMGYKKYNYASMSRASCAWWANFTQISYVVFNVLNVLSNLLVSRTSEEALFAAFFLSFVGSIVCLHRILPRFVLNSIQCFSWHFLKISFPVLREARGYNLQHLLVACAINLGAFVVSCRFQPEVDRRLAAVRARRGRQSARSRLASLASQLLKRSARTQLNQE